VPSTEITIVSGFIAGCEFQQIPIMQLDMIASHHQSLSLAIPWLLAGKTWWLDSFMSEMYYLLCEVIALLLGLNMNHSARFKGDG
jgi:hypothetical protein